LPANDLRKDYLLDKWVVIAKERKKRPTDFVQKETERPKTENCPFCPGNEHMTPPATLVYISSQGSIKKDKDTNGFRHKNWLVRCVPNMYPAFTPPLNEGEWKNKSKFRMAQAFGHHEVIIESPKHTEHPSIAKLEQLKLVINAIIDRTKVFSEKPYVKYVSIFRNHGKEAGASLSHAHTQIIATSLLPKIIKEEARVHRNFRKKHKECIYCRIIEIERESPRFIWENECFIIFAPWASASPFEFWILPKRHSSHILDMNRKELNDFTKTLRVALGGLKTLLNDPPYNFGIHMASTLSNEDFHWHLEVYPKLAIWAGFEKSTGIYINVIPPEDAAGSLREIILQEEKKISF